MKKLNIKVQKIRKDAETPKRASDGAVGYDLFASVVLNEKTKEITQELPIEISPGQRLLIGAGVKIAVPWPYQAEVRPRSGLAGEIWHYHR